MRCGERQVIPAAVDWAAAAFTQDKVSPNFTAESNESVFFKKAGALNSNLTNKLNPAFSFIAIGIKQSSNKVVGYYGYAGYSV